MRVDHICFHVKCFLRNILRLKIPKLCKTLLITDIFGDNGQKFCPLCFSPCVVVMPWFFPRDSKKHRPRRAVFKEQCFSSGVLRHFSHFSKSYFLHHAYCLGSVVTIELFTPNHIAHVVTQVTVSHQSTLVTLDRNSSCHSLLVRIQ